MALLTTLKPFQCRPGSGAIRYHASPLDSWPKSPDTAVHTHTPDELWVSPDSQEILTSGALLQLLRVGHFLGLPEPPNDYFTASDIETPASTTLHRRPCPLSTDAQMKTSDAHISYGRRHESYVREGAYIWATEKREQMKN
eukprot:6017674-Pleurochrysis_carterae.AAC.2